MVSTNVAALLASRKWFTTEESYESFCTEVVIPCFTALAVAVAKDTLWKPLNHSILMLSRDAKKIVRVVCVKALHHLFTEVTSYGTHVYFNLICFHLFLGGRGISNNGSRVLALHIRVNGRYQSICDGGCSRVSKIY